MGKIFAANRIARDAGGNRSNDRRVFLNCSQISSDSFPPTTTNGWIFIIRRNWSLLPSHLWYVDYVSFQLLHPPSLNRVPFLHQFPSDLSIPGVESLFQTEFQFIQVFIDRLHGILEFRTKKLGSIVERGWRKLAIVKILFRREGEDLTLR